MSSRLRIDLYSGDYIKIGEVVITLAQKNGRPRKAPIVIELPREQDLIWHREGKVEPA